MTIVERYQAGFSVISQIRKAAVLITKYADRRQILKTSGTLRVLLRQEFISLKRHRQKVTGYPARGLRPVFPYDQLIQVLIKTGNRPYDNNSLHSGPCGFACEFLKTVDRVMAFKLRDNLHVRFFLAHHLQRKLV